MEVLEQLGIIPVDYGALRSLLSGYNFPQNKIANLEREGKIIRLKRGLYVVSPDISKQLISVELIANHLYGPSYVSMESALRYYGLIPEQVHTVRSITVNRAKRFENTTGSFEYITVGKEYYPIGIRQQANDKYAFLIASPEKALCDLITATPYLKFQSAKAVATYLEYDLRFDMSALQNMDVTIVEQCAATGKKKGSLRMMLNLLRQ